MSRIGLKPIEIPSGVDITIDNHKVTVKGPKGELSETVDSRFNLVLEDGELRVERPDETKETKSLHGLYRSLVANMVEGVTEGYSKKLLIEGTGYRAQKQAKNLVMNLGYAHQVIMADTDEVETEVPDDRTIIVRGINKQAVGNFAANIRKWRLPEPYKGKGIRYENEYVRRKVGKTGK